MYSWSRPTFILSYLPPCVSMTGYSLSAPQAFKDSIQTPESSFILGRFTSLAKGGKSEGSTVYSARRLRKLLNSLRIYVSHIRWLLWSLEGPRGIHSFSSFLVTLTNSQSTFFHQHIRSRILFSIVPNMGDTNNAMASAGDDELSEKPPPSMLRSSKFRTPYIYEGTDSGDDDDEILLRRRVTSRQSSSPSCSGPGNGMLSNSSILRSPIQTVILVPAIWPTTKASQVTLSRTLKNTCFNKAS